jgi:8-oxo-dGTP diphosphatase
MSSASGSWLPPDRYYASLSKNLASAGVLFTDSAERVLIVKPKYRDHWLLVGGVVDEGETPEQACRREVGEEIGINRAPGRLLLVDWTSPTPKRPLPLVGFIFDGGVVAREQLRLDHEELDDYRFLPPELAGPLMSKHGRRRLTTSLEAKRSGVLRYHSC